jgi:two-component system cell cycle sensor histidine kinase/response regulator CckA
VRTTSDARPAILIVDDDASKRRRVRNALTSAGYVTLEASHVGHAEALIRSYQGMIVLAILEVVMPGKGGLDFANQLARELPATKILYISGYVDSVAVESIGRQQPAVMLIEPFTTKELLARVHDLIGREGVPP